jgi:hypothetical protein
MGNDKPESGTDNPSESLSATGMFIRAFGEKPKAESAPVDPLFGPPMQQPSQPATPKQAPGEFTQLFQSLEAKPIAPSAASGSPASTAASAVPQARLGTAPVKTPPQTGADQAGAPGEFTKLFVGGTSAAPPAVRRSTEESVKPATPPAQSSSRGFSAPGVSGSASGEGSFTQIFSTPQAKTSSPLGEPQPANPAGNAGWNNDPIFRSPQGPPPSEPASPSVTTLLASLGTPGGSPAGRAPEPAPYRPEPSPRPAPLISHEPPEVGAGGVTRLIQRLAQTPVEAAPAPTPVAAAPPVNAGPGEFTRIISRQNAAAAEPPVAAPPPAAPAPAPAGFAFPAAPPAPALAPPAAPPAPKFAPPALAVPMPVAPKPPAVAAPAVTPPKTKLEAMVPILLVINTFLLLILLVVVIFLVKSR